MKNKMKYSEGGVSDEERFWDTLVVAIRLSPEALAKLEELIENPPAPSPGLIAAVKRHASGNGAE